MQVRSPLVIGFVGVSGSGKTTIAHSTVSALREDKHEVAYIRTDHYYKDVSHLSKEEKETYNFDVPDALDIEGLLNDLTELVEGKTIKRRQYAYAITEGDDISEEIAPAKIIVVEGLFLLADQRVRNIFSMIFMVDTPADLAITRRLLRDHQTQNNVHKSLKDYESQIKPAATAFVLNYKHYAHHILKNENPTEKKQSIQYALAKINEKLSITPDQLPPSKKLLLISPLLIGVGFFACKLLLGNENSVDFRDDLKPSLR